MYQITLYCQTAFIWRSVFCQHLSKHFYSQHTVCTVETLPASVVVIDTHVPILPIPLGITALFPTVCSAWDAKYDCETESKCGTHARTRTHSSTEAEQGKAQIVQVVFIIKEETLMKNCNHAVVPKQKPANEGGI